MAPPSFWRDSSPLGIQLIEATSIFKKKYIYIFTKGAFAYRLIAVISIGLSFTR